MLVYLDSSALIKRFASEEHAQALRDRLAELQTGPNELITSTLGWVEVSRAVKQRGVQDAAVRGRDAESDALAGVAGYPISYDVIAIARRIGNDNLRSLDAIHCATATITDADRLIAYDKNLLRSAAAMGLRTESPGVSE